jgi:hypothetical protein
MQTEPPPRANFCETVNQWIIYDSYVTYETAKVPFLVFFFMNRTRDSNWIAPCLEEL